MDELERRRKQQEAQRKAAAADAKRIAKKKADDAKAVYKAWKAGQKQRERDEKMKRDNKKKK